MVSWLAIAGETGSVRLRRVAADGSSGGALEVAVTGAARSSGFPRLARVDETLYVAWVDTGPEEGQRLRALAVALDRLPPPL